MEFKKRKEMLEQYSAKIHSALIDVIQDEENENYIDLEEVIENGTANEFFIAMAVAAPVVIYSTLSGESKDMLEFTHILNGITHQYLRDEAVDKK